MKALYSRSTARGKKVGFNKRRNKTDFAFRLVNGLILIFLTLICVMPFLYMIIASLTPTDAYLRYGISFPPKGITLQNYFTFLGKGSRLYTAYGVTIFTTIVGTLMGLFLTVSAAYPLSKKYLPGRRQMNIFLLVTMFFSAGLIPRYILVKELTLINTIWSIIIPQALAVWYIFLMRRFFSDIPDSLEESAKIDGANDLYILFRIYIPLSLPSFATIGLFYAVGRWNEWFEASIFLSNRKMFPLQLVLRQIISFSQAVIDVSGMTSSHAAIPSVITKMTAIIVAVLPILCVYPFVQKYFIKGVMVGSIKA